MSGSDRQSDVGRLVNAIVSLGADLDLSTVLRRLTEAAVHLARATYGAVGVLDAEGTSLSAFVTVGIDDETAATIGDLPKGHGILGLLIVDPRPVRLDDLGAHPESFGFPPGHPTMTSFLGVPILVRGEVFGNLYLTDKQGGGSFDAADEGMVVGLAAAAGVAIENARLLARARTLEITEERERIARDLHDTVIQRLFATGLSLQAATRLTDEPEVVDRIQQAVDELDITVRDVRSSIFELNPPPTTSRGLRRELLGVGDEFFDALGYSPTFRFDGPVDSAISDAMAIHVVSVVREGLANIAKHAGSPTAEVRVTVSGGMITVRLIDSGRGLSAGGGSGNGLKNLQARADEVQGSFEAIDRDEGGTELRWEAPTHP